MSDTGPHTDGVPFVPRRAGRVRLLPPRVGPRDIVRRRVLAEMMVDRARPVTVLQAPAGYGKTTALATWLTASALPVAWLSLAPEDDAPAALLGAMLEAVEPLAPEGVGGRAMARLALDPNGDPARLGEDLAADLDAIPGPWAMVLDDLHEIAGAAANAVLAGFVAAAPPGLHLALSGRLLPQFPLTRVRAEDRLAFIDAQVLRFDGDDVQALAERLRLRLDAPGVARCLDLSVGWPAVVRQFVARSDVAASVDVREPVDEVARYLVATAIGSSGDGFQVGLERVSVVDAVSVELFAAVCEAPVADIAAPFAAWVQESALATPVGDDDQWWRIHPLARHLLGERLLAREGAAGLRDAHRRVARWFDARGMADLVVRHALAAGDEAVAVVATMRAGFGALEAERWGDIGPALDRLPPGVEQRHAGTMVLRCWCDYHLPSTGVDVHLEHARALVEAIDPAGESEWSRARLAAHLDVHATFRITDLPDAGALLARCDEIASRLPFDDGNVRGILRAATALGVMLDRDRDLGLAAFDRWLNGDEALTASERAVLLSGMAMGFTLVGGDDPRIESTMRQLADHAEREGLPGSRVLSATWLGWLALTRWDLAGARHWFARGPNELKNVPINVWRRHRFLVALLAAMEGDAATANAVAEEIVEVLVGTEHVEWLRNCQSFQARLWILQRRYEEVERWLAGLPPGADVESPLVLESLAITRIRALLLKPTPERLQEAALSLDRLAAMPVGPNLQHLREAIGVCRAMLHDQRGNRRAALRTLRLALETVAPRGDVLLIAEYGERVAGMVAALAARGEVAPDYSAQVVAASAELARHYPDPYSLSRREREVVIGLAAGKTMREIADEASISASAVSAHATRAYRKLGGGSRSEALVRARALGLDQPDDV